MKIWNVKSLFWLIAACACSASAIETTDSPSEPKDLYDAYQQSERSEPQLSDADRRIMPYVLGLFVDGQTKDGKHVRLNVPIHVRVEPAKQTSRGLFPLEGDRVGRTRLDEMYRKLEGIFSDAFSRVSTQFSASEYYQSAPSPTRRCNVGSAELCEALEHVWPSAVREAMSDGTLNIAVVAKWVNHFGTYDNSPARSWH